MTTKHLRINYVVDGELHCDDLIVEDISDALSRVTMIVNKPETVVVDFSYYQCK